MQKPSERNKLTSDNNIIKFKKFMTPLSVIRLLVINYSGQLDILSLYVKTVSLELKK